MSADGAKYKTNFGRQKRINRNRQAENSRMNLLRITGQSLVLRIMQFFFDFGKNIVLLSVLTVEAFGLLNLLNIFVNSTKYVDLGFRQRYKIGVYAKEIDKSKKSAIFQTIVAVEMSLSVCLVILVLGYTKFFNIDLPVGSNLTLLVVGVLFSARVYRLTLIFLEAEKAFVKAAFLECFTSLIFLVSVFIFRKNAEVLLFLFTTQLAAYLLTILFIGRVWWSKQLNFDWLIKNARESFFVGLATFLNGVSFYADRLILLTYFSLRDVGLYAAILFGQNISQTLANYIVKPLGSEIIYQIASSKKIDDKLLAVLYVLFVVPPLSVLLFNNPINWIAEEILSAYLPKYLELAQLANLLALTCALFPAVAISGLIVLEPSMRAYRLFSLSQLFPLCFVLGLFAILQNKAEILIILMIATFLGTLFKILLFSFIIGRNIGLRALEAKLAVYAFSMIGALGIIT